MSEGKRNPAERKDYLAMADLKDMFTAQVSQGTRITINSKGTSPDILIYRFFRNLENGGKFQKGNAVSGLIGIFDLSAMKDVPFDAFGKAPIGNVGTENSRYCYIFDAAKKQVLCEKPRAVHVEEVTNRHLAFAKANGIVK